MKRIICILLSAVLFASCFSVIAFADTATEANARLNTTYSAFINGTLGDVEGDGKFSAKDAKYILRYAAQLESKPANTKYVDLDHDGIVTAADARKALRFSAKLAVDDVHALEAFNEIINNVKANMNNTEFHYGTRDTTDVSWDNDSLVKSFDSQMEKLNQLDDSGSSTENFSSSLADGNGTVYHSPPTTKAYRLAVHNSEFPLADMSYSSKLTIDDVKKTEFKTNQTVTLQFKGNDGDEEFGPVTLNGLNMITVTLKDDESSSLPSSFNSFHASKVFDLPDAAKLKQEADSVKNEMSGISDVFNGDATNEDGEIFKIKDLFKSTKFNLTAEINRFDIKNSTVSVYFKPDTGKPVAIVYNLNYTYNSKMFMDIDITLRTVTNDPGFFANMFGNAIEIAAITMLATKGVKGEMLKISNGTLNVTNNINAYGNYYIVTNDT